MRVWRICRKRHAATAFSGEGARLTSGRWNFEGVPVAYASEHLSLAALELFVHADEEDDPRDLMAVEAELSIAPKIVISQKREILEKLRPDWQSNPDATRTLGHTWFTAHNSLIMMIPSAVIDVEWNILVNPQHKDFSGLKIVRTRPFRFDSRMFKR